MPSSRVDRERGQFLVIFAIALVAIIAAVGLVLDGGGAFVQRREQQNVADAAAMAAGYSYLNTSDQSRADAAAKSVAAANGYTHGVGSTVITVALAADGIHETVSIGKQHRNYFAGIVGMATWDVGTTATVMMGVPNSAIGAMPILFNKKAFALASNRNPLAPATFGEPPPGQNPLPDVPQTSFAFNWTVFCTAGGTGCNADSTTVEGLIDQNGTATTVSIADGINPLNAGAHNTLFNDLALHVGNSYPVPVVDDTGLFVGWATFHLTGAVGGSSKEISGWLDDKVTPAAMTITPTGGHPLGTFGSYVNKLTN